MRRQPLTGAFAKLERLRQMSPREIAYRISEKARLQWERFGLAHSPPSPGAFKGYLASGPSRRFYRGARESNPPFGEWVDRAQAEAEALCRHEVELLSLGRIALGPEIDWRRDPVTGSIWKQRFWADYRLEQTPDGQDVKIVHELNRHQHLPRLAKAYWLTGNTRYAAEAVEQLLSWIEQNPAGQGVNWHSSLELAIRAISWLWTLFLILPSDELSDAAAQRIGESLFAQLDHVHRYPSVYSSPNTHLIGEAAALFIGGLVFQDQQCGHAWMEAGAALLQQEAERQVLDDGVHAELSSYYHCYALDFFLQAVILAEQNGFYFPPILREKVEAMLQFLMHLTRPDGALPLLGDDDGGRALALHQRTYRSFRDAMAAGAVLFRRGDFKRQAGEFTEETWLFLGHEGWDGYEALPDATPASHEMFCPEAGCFIERSGWGHLDHHLVFDCGGLGMGTGGHSHADSLAVTLQGGGRELLIDPGTFVYNGAHECRRYFRSTGAHNTVSVDGRDQAEPAGTFRWRTGISSRCGLSQDLSMRYAEGEHHGYAPEVIHRRRIVSLRGEYWLLLDDLRGFGSHRFRFHYHFAPGVDVSGPDQLESAAQVWAEEAGLSLAMCASTVVESRLASGWASAGYGERRPARSLEVDLAAEAPVFAMTFVSCGFEGVLQPVPAGFGAVACSYRHGHFRDIAALSSSDSELAVEGFKMRGEFFWLRMQGESLVAFKAIGAVSLMWEGRDLLEDASCAQYAAF